MDISWILEESIRVTKLGDRYIVHENGGEFRRCVIEMKGERMTFDGEDIETEDFMAFVGLLDAVDEQPAGSAVMFEKER